MVPGIDSAGLYEYIFGAMPVEVPQGAVVITVRRARKLEHIWDAEYEPWGCLKELDWMK